MVVYILKVWTYADTESRKKDSTYIFEVYANEEDAKIWMNELNQMFLKTNQPKVSYYDTYSVK